uniref:Uncharacterized protein n=1 Tax=Hyaloperonospora arabidopsidis (strain Emoy2) TaxID=559515 RepID=M4BLD1_HYAAE
MFFRGQRFTSAGMVHVGILKSYLVYLCPRDLSYLRTIDMVEVYNHTRRNGLPIRISRYGYLLQTQFDYYGCDGTSSHQDGGSTLPGNEEGAILLSDLRRRRDAYIQKRDILSNRLNAESKKYAPFNHENIKMPQIIRNQKIPHVLVYLT